MKNTLERRILAAAKWQIRSIERYGLNQSNANTLIYVFECDGVFDLLYYDNVKKRWSHIEYTVGKGQAILGRSFTGYFNETETRTINL